MTTATPRRSSPGFRAWPQTVLAGAVAASSLGACTSAATSLTTGDCFDKPEDSTYFSSVSIIACDQEHDSEVIHSFTVSAEEFPGEETLANEAEDTCVAAFEDYVGIAFSDSELDMYPVTPTEDSWSQADDRTVLCVATTADGASALETSVRGLAR